MKKLVSVLLAFMILGSVLFTSCFTGVLAETAEEENNVAELMGVENPESMEKTLTLSVSGMMCEKCVAHVKAAIEGVDGTESVRVSLEEGTAEAVYNGNPETLAAAVKAAGYKAKVKK